MCPGDPSGLILETCERPGAMGTGRFGNGRAAHPLCEDVEELGEKWGVTHMELAV